MAVYPILCKSQAARWANDTIHLLLNKIYTICAIPPIELTVTADWRLSFNRVQHLDNRVSLFHQNVVDFSKDHSHILSSDGDAF